MPVYSTYQAPYTTIFFSGGQDPLKQWETHIKDGSITRFLDPELKVLVTDIKGLNVSTTYITCPKDNKTLGIHLPFLVMIVKNLKKYFTFEITILDDSGFKRRFRVANFQSDTKVTCTSTVMPICLADGWNQIQFNLSDFTRRAYNRQFFEVVSLRINANIRLRRIYFTQRLFEEEELPTQYRLFYPVPPKHRIPEPAIRYNDIPPEFSKEIIEPAKETPRRESTHSVGSVGSKNVSNKSLNVQTSSCSCSQDSIKSQTPAKTSQTSVRKSQSAKILSKQFLAERKVSVKEPLLEKHEKESEDSSILKQLFKVSSSKSAIAPSASRNLQKSSITRASRLSTPKISRTYKQQDIFPEQIAEEEEARLSQTNVDGTEESESKKSSLQHEKRSIAFANEGPAYG